MPHPGGAVGYEPRAPAGLAAGPRQGMDASGSPGFETDFAHLPELHLAAVGAN